MPKNETSSKKGVTSTAKQLKQATPAKENKKVALSAQKKAAIGITDTNRQIVAAELAKLLADENILYIKTKKAHWNIEGADFYDKHKFFETQFVQLDNMIDKVAERIRSIDHYVPATLKSYLSLTHLTEQSRAENNSEGFIKELLQDHESIISVLREQIKWFANDFRDSGSSNFFTDLKETHEKMAWFLRSHLNN